MNIQIRPAILDDVPAIVELVAANARKGGLLPRSEASIRAALHNFSVAIMEIENAEARKQLTELKIKLTEPEAPLNEAESPVTQNPKSKAQNFRVVGCGSLLPMNTTLVELRSLAVDETIRGAGIGQKLVAALIEEAKRRKFGTIFALTRAMSFFEKCGFTITPKEQFPEKVWRDCVACPMLANCDEVAVTMSLTEQGTSVSQTSIISVQSIPTNGKPKDNTPSPQPMLTSQPPFVNEAKIDTKKRRNGEKQQVNKVILAYSGGLDTSVIVPWLRENYNCEVICFTADIGQSDNLDEVQKKALKSGASKSIVLDLRDEFANEYLFPLVQSGAIYENKYMLGAAIARPLIAKYQVELAAQEGADAVAHGATGKGNDQVRFELSYFSLNPRLKIIAPWREWQFKGREDLLKYAKQKGVTVAQSASNVYTRDENLWHVMHEGGELEDLDGEPDDKMFHFTISPEDALDKPEFVEIDFISGIPKRLNGKGMSGADLINFLNQLGGKHGIGRVDLVQNRLIGLKTHSVVETPGGSILRAAHLALEEITLDRDTSHYKQQTALKYADLVYNGQWFTPLRDALQAFVAVTQRDVTGSVKLKLYKGNITPVGRKANYSLYREDLATFMRDEAFEHKDAGGFIRLYGLPMRVKAQVDLNRAAFAPPVIPFSSK